MMLFLQSLMSERRQANLSCSSGFPIIKTPDATSDETPVVRELPLVIFCEFVTADVLLLLSLWGQLDTVLSRWNKWDKGRCPCTYFIRSFLVSSFIPSFSKAFTAILFSHLTILSNRAFFLLPSVCNDWLPNRKNPLIYSSKHIAMSHRYESSCSCASHMSRVSHKWWLITSCTAWVSIVSTLCPRIGEIRLVLHFIFCPYLISLWLTSSFSRCAEHHAFFMKEENMKHVTSRTLKQTTPFESLSECSRTSSLGHCIVLTYGPKYAVFGLVYFFFVWLIFCPFSQWMNKLLDRIFCV